MGSPPGGLDWEAAVDRSRFVFAFCGRAPPTHGAADLHLRALSGDSHLAVSITAIRPTTDDNAIVIAQTLKSVTFGVLQGEHEFADRRSQQQHGPAKLVAIRNQRRSLDPNQRIRGG